MLMKKIALGLVYFIILDGDEVVYLSMDPFDAFQTLESFKLYNPETEYKFTFLEVE